MTKSLTTTLFVCFALAITACQPHHSGRSGKKSTTVDPDSILADKSLTPAQKSEKLALGAEQLTTPASFMFADSVADLALQQDKNNLRAQLIKALVKPAVLTKGIITRIKPLSDTTEGSKAEYAKLVKQVNAWPNIELKKFLLDKSQPEIKTEADAQKFAANLTGAFNNLRLFFKKHKDMEMTLNLPDLWKQKAIQDKSEDCEVTQKLKDDESRRANQPIIELICDYGTVGEYKIDRAESETFQNIAAGAVIYTTLLNAYNLDGTAKVVASAKDNASNKQNYESLIKTKSWGTLRDAAGLKGLTDLGLDFIAGARWAAQMQSSLCRVSSHFPESKGNRPGYLLEEGICIDTKSKDSRGWSFESVLRTAEFALQGGVIGAFVVPQDGTEFVYETQVKPSAAFTNPIADVRSLGPVTWSSSGQGITATGDKTLGGIFPKGDANTVLGIDGDIHLHVK